jgi:hypothetical protein
LIANVPASGHRTYRACALISQCFGFFHEHIVIAGELGDVEDRVEAHIQQLTQHRTGAVRSTIEKSIRSNIGTEYKICFGTEKTAGILFCPPLFPAWY